MKSGVLEAYSFDTLELLFRLEAQDGDVRVAFVVPDLASQVDAWLGGLSTWTGTRQDPEPSWTPPGAPEFLERLQAYLHKQFAFVTRLHETVHADSPPRPRSSSG
jgi:hypothetical protein